MQEELTKLKDLDGDTRHKLLAAAQEVFAQNGYIGATTNDICKRASANVAAVCYYFGGKLNLYKAVWEQVGKASANNLRAILAQASDPEEQIRLYIRSGLSDSLSGDKTNTVSLLLYREFGNPSPIFDEIFNVYLLSSKKILAEMLDAFMGHPCDKVLANQCFLCLKSSLLLLLDLKMRSAESKPKFDTKKMDEDLNFHSSPERLMKNIETFTIGGLKALREISFPE